MKQASDEGRWRMQMRNAREVRFKGDTVECGGVDAGGLWACVQKRKIEARDLMALAPTRLARGENFSFRPPIALQRHFTCRLS